MGLILLIFGIVFACRIPGILKMTANSFPAQNQVMFDEWRTKELKSIYIFLAATWGQMAVFFAIGLAVGVAFRNDTNTLGGLLVILTVVELVVFIGGLIWAAVLGSQAAKLKKEMMSPAAPSGGVYPRAGQTVVNMPAPPPEIPKTDV